MKPRLLDLFCGAGGCSVGYARAGFEVVGVDIDPQPNYPYDFVETDALEYLKSGDWDFRVILGRSGFDAIHASPPCQDYLNLSRVNDALGRERRHARLIWAVRELLVETGLPYVIENGPDAAAELWDPVKLCGSSFGLAVRRHRLFECTFPTLALPCAHHLQSDAKYWTSWRPNGQTKLAKVVQVYGNGANREEWGPAMGIDWMTPEELREAVPPAYTEHIGHYLKVEILQRKAAV